MFRSSILIALLSAAPVALAQDKPRPDALQITEAGERYHLAVPVSRLVMTIPKGELARRPGGGGSHPRYFYFGGGGLNVSGWFEPARGFKGIKDFWSEETAAWKRKGLPEARDVSFAKISNWDVVIYDIAMPMSGTNSHYRAHWVQSGTWIDLHVSLTSKEPSANVRARLADFLKSIQVSEKDK